MRNMRPVAAGGRMIGDERERGSELDPEETPRVGIFPPNKFDQRGCIK